MASKREVDLKLALDTKTIRASVNRASDSFGKLSKDIKRSVFRANKQLGDLNRSFRNIGIAAGVASAVGLYAFNTALKEAVGLANVQEEAEIKLAGVLRATGEAAGLSLQALKDYASHLQSITTVGDEVTIAGMSILATFREIKGDQFKEATKAAIDMSAVMGTDLKSSIIQVGKALNDPTKGLTALSRAGVTFTEAQKEQIKSLQKSGNLIGAQKIILAELKGEFGAVAEALRGSFKGAVDSAGNAFGDLKEEIGYTISKNSFFLESTKLAEESMATYATSIKENRADWMELSKTMGITFVHSVGIANEAVRAFYNAWKGLVLIAHGAVIVINQGLLSIVTTTRAVMFKFDLLFTALEKVGAIDKNPFDRVLDGMKGFGEVSKEEFLKIWEDVEKANSAFDKITDSVDKFKTHLETISAKEVDPAAGILESTKKVEQELVKIGGVWVDVNKEKAVAAKKSTDEEINELDRFKDAAGITWRELQKDAGRSVESILADLQKVRAEIEKPYVMKVVKQESSSGGGGGGGFATGGRVYGPGGIDIVPAWLTAGEYVINKQAVDKFGYGLFHALNSMQMPVMPKFATGGPVIAGSVVPPQFLGHYTHDINFSGLATPVRVMTDRENAESLIRGLKHMQNMAS